MEPDWATPGATTATTTTTQDANVGSTVTSANTNNTNGAGSYGRERFILVLLSIGNMAISCLMGALGVLALIDFTAHHINDFSEAFLSAYMVMFAAMLFSYELIWWTSIPWINVMLRKNFGFLYGLRSKGLFEIFVAFLVIGVQDFNDLNWLRYTAGGTFLGMGALHLFFTCANPDLMDVYQAPTVGLLSKHDSPQFSTGDGAPSNAV